MTDFINSDAARAANLPFSLAVRAGGVLYLSGAIGNIAGKMELVPGGIEAESRQMMVNIAAVLQQAGSGFAHVVKCVVYLADMAEGAPSIKFTSLTSRPGDTPPEPPLAPIS
ncbi:MAG TPA: Rid family hydrolase [Rhizomicrobium sp.]|nr:Rid family hydrolase [Rhizomicrobium sp.]